MSGRRALPYVLGAAIGACVALVLLLLFLTRGNGPGEWFARGTTEPTATEEHTGPLVTRDSAWTAALGDSIAAGRSNALVTATKRAQPAVVSITVFYTEFVRVAANPVEAWLSQGRVQRLPFEILGSGVIVDERGYIVTNDHVLGQKADQRIFVTLADGRQFEAEVVGRVRSRDLALLKFLEDVPRMPVAVLGDSDLLEPGEWAIAIGAPYRELLEDSSLTVTVGVISALQRDLKQFDDRADQPIYLDMIQTDAAIHQGNSGGALVNARGEVIGINAFIISGSDGGSFGASFAVPINRVRRVLNEILEYGEIRPSYSGFDGIVIDAYARGALELAEDRHGVLVTVVDPQSPAESAGLKPGDFLVAIGEIPIMRRRDYYRALYDSVPGSVLVLTIEREEQRLELSLTLAEARVKGPPTEDGEGP